jgi:hypothetical protein
MLNDSSDGTSIKLLATIGVMALVSILAFTGIYSLTTSSKETKLAEVNEETSITNEEVISEHNATMSERSANITARSSIDRMSETTTEEDSEIANSLANTIEKGIEDLKYISIDEVKISSDMDITQFCGLSRDDFIKLISDCKADTAGWFEAHAGQIYDLCHKYQLNEIFFCGLISAESGWTIASNHRSTNNFISLMSNGRLKRYSSEEEGLEVAARTLHNNYLSEGGSFYYGKTLAAMNTKFCGSATWVSLVYGRMKQIVK